MKSCYLHQLKLNPKQYYCATEGCSIRDKPEIKPFVLSNSHLLDWILFVAIALLANVWKAWDRGQTPLE